MAPIQKRIPYGARRRLSAQSVQSRACPRQAGTDVVEGNGGGHESRHKLASAMLQPRDHPARLINRSGREHTLFSALQVRATGSRNAASHNQKENRTDGCHPV